ncbi:MAG: MMPL family transporter [Nitrospirae bacterium]|nr:MMPL family transporter [Nitrospirota bacterium]
MKRFSLVEFSVEHPRLIVILSIIITLAFMTQFPKITTDTNPKHMLPETSEVRVWNDEVDRTFGLYEDMIVVGVANEKGIVNPGTLEKIKRITDEIIKIKGVASRDVNSFPTITNVTAEKGTLRVAPLMTNAPKNEGELEDFRKNLFDNPLFLNRIISKDGKNTAIYVPLEKGSNGKEIADRIREIIKLESLRAGKLSTEKYYVAGDPVARDTFGAEMFKLMGIFSPISGMIMLIASYIMFRSLFLSISIMIPAMIIIIWSMGLLIGMGFPIHIMSSMSPVFLMAIATDSIHIFNEFYFRYREKGDKKAAIIETMKVVRSPLIYTDITTAVGFGSLMLANIIPVKVFGFGVGFGTIALLLLSFSIVPALLTFIKVDKIERIIAREDISTSRTSIFLRKLGSVGAYRPKTTVTIGLILFVFAVIGITKIVVNNNMVEWFKENSEVRVADREINNALGGTSLGYMVAISREDDFIKKPDAMRYIEGLQRHIEKLRIVGKTFSVADYVKRINRVLHDDDPKYDVVPDTKEAVGQYLFLFSMSAKPSDLDNVVDPSFKKANIWVQLKTWDAGAMGEVIKAADEYKKSNPISLELKPAGIAYFNLVWNHEVLWDMVKGFIFALVAVFIILIFNFRSFKWALVSYVPLVFTVLLIYGVIGLSGKRFDMPISVLSSLSLGMAVDFAIHFVSRFRQHLSEKLEVRSEKLEDAKNLVTRHSSLVTESLLWTAARPGKGIMRNAVLFAASFAVMMFAPLTPYITVGAFIVSMMLLSAIMTIIYIPALITLMQGWLFKEGG